MNRNANRDVGNYYWPVVATEEASRRRYPDFAKFPILFRLIPFYPVACLVHAWGYIVPVHHVGWTRLL